MRMGLPALAAMLPVSASTSSAQQVPEQAKLNDRLAGDIAPTPDPVIAREGDTYYVFATGRRGGTGL